MKKSGIYIITNITNNKVYIGSAIDIKHRIRTHRWDLKHNKHHSPRLQHSYNKYKEDNFTFDVLEYVDKELLIEKEQFYIDKYQSFNDAFGYNICHIAGSRLGSKASPETREKLRISHLGICKGIKSPSYGKKHSEESKEKMRAAQFGKKLSQATKRKISENQIGKIRKNNKSGFVGVAYFKRTHQWTAEITINKVRYRLGYFNTPEAAAQAYQKALYDYKQPIAT